MLTILLATSAVHSSSSGRALHAGRAHRSESRGPSRFSWDTLAVGNATSCGCNKCYFPLSERENEGWLVGNPTCEHTIDRSTSRGVSLGPVFPEGFGCDDASASPPWFPQYGRTWTFAERLRTRFGVGHMLSRPPEIASLTPEQAASLNFNLKHRVDKFSRPCWATRRNRSIPWWEKATAEPKRYYSPGPHPVQAVRSCPWPTCIMLGCQFLKANSFARGATSFIANAPNKTELGQGIKKNFALVAAMVMAHPCLKLDFQVFLRNDGRVLNIDLDRCDQLELGTSMHSPPLSEAFQRNMTAFQLKLARIPGLCVVPREQARLIKAIERLYES
mgnify:CR=1 FL=1